MPKRRSPRHVRIFLASPGDVLEERHAVREMLQRLERSPLIREDFTIEVVSWDDPDAPVPMLATVTPQQAVSRALPSPAECDFTVVIVSGRMGTPLDERKPDGSRYRSGTEWEFEDARQAGRPILLYRRTNPGSFPDDDPEEVARQLRSVQEFFSQFTRSSGALAGGVTPYRTVEELVSRLRTDIETLLPALRPNDDVVSEETFSSGDWTGRAQARVRGWHYGRLLLILVPGILVTLLAWTAFATFSSAIEEYEAPPFAHVIRYVLFVLGVLIPIVLLLVTWWWLGRDRTTRAA